MKKRKRRNGDPYQYRPRYDLLQRLSRETGMPLETVLDELIKERDYLLSRPDGEAL